MGIPARRDLPVWTKTRLTTGKSTCPCHPVRVGRRSSETQALAGRRRSRRAVVLNLDSIQMRINLAEVLARCGQIDEAADMFESFADQAPAGSEQDKLYRKQVDSLRSRN